MAARMRLDGLTVDRKTSISDVVSDADKAAEAMIVRRLAVARPADGVIGEEGAAAPGRRTWVIDPVDGTYNFVSGLPAWCSALALLDGEHLVLGAIYQATTDELWVGGRDLPTTLNGVPLPQLADRALAEVAISAYLHPSRVGDLPLRDGLLRAIAGAASVRIIGSGIGRARRHRGRPARGLAARRHPVLGLAARRRAGHRGGRRRSTCSIMAAIAGTSPARRPGSPRPRPPSSATS